MFVTSHSTMEMLKGCNRFCNEYAFIYKVFSCIADEPIETGEVYINLMEYHLVTFIERIISLQLKVGEEAGVISYNDTPLKKIILNGITTISTDFRKMGAMAASMILENKKEHLEMPFYLTLRASL